VGPSFGLNVCGRYPHHWDSIPVPSSLSRVAVPTELARTAERLCSSLVLITTRLNGVINHDCIFQLEVLIPFPSRFHLYLASYCLSVIRKMDLRQIRVRICVCPSPIFESIDRIWPNFVCASWHCRLHRLRSSHFLIISRLNTTADRFPI
jgi:hypothetical protein